MTLSQGIRMFSWKREGSFKRNHSESHPGGWKSRKSAYERDFSTDNIPLLPPPSPLPPHSEMKRKRDACNQADVDTEFRRGVPPPSIPEEGWKVSNMTRREQISRVLATPPVTTSQHHHGGCSHGDGGASILTLRGGNSREYLRLGRSFFPSSAFFLPLPSLFHATSHFSRLFNVETRLATGGGNLIPW